MSIIIESGKLTEISRARETTLATVHVKIADNGWILERCAAELAASDNRVSFGKNSNADADIQYYVNYSAYRGRISPIEIGFFTHIEERYDARRTFFDVAKKMDHCVCMAERYAQELREAGIQNVSVIRPGVDLDSFSPKLRIGVIGRTYESGRKGEDLVAQVMNEKGIDWFFTGSGWPGPALHLQTESMAEFYNSLDYVLVPARYEGGPMSVIEGLACGKEIISSDVGWAQEFPHIEFENGNVDSLRTVLRSLLAKRYELRASVLSCSWKNWGSEHRALFDRLLARRDERHSSNVSSVTTVETVDPITVMLATHGDESNTKGGPSVRVPRTVQCLNALGVSAFQFGHRVAVPDVIHLFNVWPSHSSTRFIEEARLSDIPLVLSPIFMNLDTFDEYTREIPNAYGSCTGDELDRQLAQIQREIEDRPNLPVREPFPGYYESVCKSVELADHVILLSEYERNCLEFIGAGIGKNSSIVQNPVNIDIFNSSSADLFKRRYGLDRYILQVGRIEPRKNQLLVAEAGRRLGIPTVFIGHVGDTKYADLVYQVAGPSARFLSRLSHNDPLFSSAIIGASVFCLPSWAEGAPLAALEAGAVGVPLILSDRASEREYFGEHAQYVNPADLSGMKDLIETSLVLGADQEAKTERSNYIQNMFSWERHTQRTADVYRDVLAKHHSYSARLGAGNSEAGRVFFDITDWALGGERLTGTARVQCNQFLSLPTELRDRVVPVTWRRGSKEFFRVNPTKLPHTSVLLGGSYQDSYPEFSLDEELFRPNDRFYSPSGAWIGNEGHFEAIMNLKSNRGMHTSIMIHDLVRLELPFFYSDSLVDVFSERLAKLASVVDGFLFYSNATERSLSKFLKEGYHFSVSGALVPLGDGLLTTDGQKPARPENLGLSDAPFILVVGSIEPRKNHILLLQALKRLQIEFGENTPRLVIAGKDHLASPQLDHWIKANQEISHLIVRLRTVSDNELEWLYANAVLSLFPSIAEGWGLPVCESFQHGTVCLASSASSTPEAARGFARLLDPYDPIAWAAAIGERIRDPAILVAERQRILDDWKPQSWKDSVILVINAVEKFPSRTMATITSTTGASATSVVAESLTSSDPLDGQQALYLATRSSWEKLLFRPTGKPKRALRRLLFHKSGEPRKVFRKLILHEDGRPHKPFRMYIK